MVVRSWKLLEFARSISVILIHKGWRLFTMRISRLPDMILLVGNPLHANGWGLEALP